MALPVAGLVALGLAGCSQDVVQGWLPTQPGTTNHVDSVISLWVNSWIVLLIVGAITWGLTIWAIIVYRRRKGQTGLPVQLRYNMPIETFFTVVPLILVLGFFAFTVKTQAPIEARDPNPDVTIEAYGKRWSWDFNYLNENVYSAGIQVQTDSSGNPIDSTVPVLYLPVGKTVEIDLKSRDVIHSFWVIDFLYKKDMIPGRTNYMTFTPEKIGEYQGKCAELCGEYHSMMLFKVKVVSQADYDAYIQSQRQAGDVGRLGDDYNTNQNEPGAAVPNPATAEQG